MRAELFKDALSNTRHEKQDKNFRNLNKYDLTTKAYMITVSLHMRLLLKLPYRPVVGNLWAAGYSVLLSLCGPHACCK